MSETTFEILMVSASKNDKALNFKVLSKHSSNGS